VLDPAHATLASGMTGAGQDIAAQTACMALVANPDLPEPVTPCHLGLLTERHERHQRGDIRAALARPLHTKRGNGGLR
jgi:hypothetical protein